MPTAFALVKGVGAYATSPSCAKSSCASLTACSGSFGMSCGCTSKNDVSAVLVYSGYPSMSPLFSARRAICSSPRFRSFLTL